MKKLPLNIQSIQDRYIPIFSNKLHTTHVHVNIPGGPTVVPSLDCTVNLQLLKRQNV